MRSPAYAIALLAALAGAAGSSEPSAAVSLNHFFIVVDPAAYQAARSSAFLTNEFAPFESRTTVHNDTSYTGILAVDFSLQHKAAKSACRVGAAELQLDGTKARLEIGPPPRPSRRSPLP